MTAHWWHVNCMSVTGRDSGRGGNGGSIHSFEPFLEGFRFSEEVVVVSKPNSANRFVVEIGKFTCKLHGLNDNNVVFDTDDQIVVWSLGGLAGDDGVALRLLEEQFAELVGAVPPMDSGLVGFKLVLDTSALNGDVEDLPHVAVGVDVVAQWHYILLVMRCARTRARPTMMAKWVASGGCSGSGSSSHCIV